MADREPTAWITINGAHVPIYEGEGYKDAVNRAIAKNNSDKRARDIAENKRQSDNARNGQKPYRVPSKNLALKDISAEDANKTSDVLNLRTRQRYKFKDGTKITQVEAFAGKGCKREFRKADFYANEKYKGKYGKAEDWQHCSGKAIITDGKRDFTREVHWVQGSDGRMRDAFIKEYSKNLEKRK